MLHICYVVLVLISKKISWLICIWYVRQHLINLTEPLKATCASIILNLICRNKKNPLSTTQILESLPQPVNSTYVILSHIFDTPSQHTVNLQKSRGEMHHFEVSSNSNQQCRGYLIYSPNNQALLQSSRSPTHINIHLFSTAGTCAHTGCSGNQADIKITNQKRLFK